MLPCASTPPLVLQYDNDAKLDKKVTVTFLHNWIELAKVLPQAKLEKEVAKTVPQFAIPEKIKPVCADRMLMQLGISEELYNMIKRVQDLESQRTKSSVNLEQTLKSLASEYLGRHDPIEKAKRFKQRQNKTTHSQHNFEQHVLRQEPLRQKPEKTNLPKNIRFLSAKLKHAINLRDQAQCTHNNPIGKRCENRRWLEIHHLKPLSVGGTNEFTNLTTLCSVHHKDLHHHPFGD